MKFDKFYLGFIAGTITTSLMIYSWLHGTFDALTVIGSMLIVIVLGILAADRGE